MQIMCNSFAVTEAELDQPVITPAECSQAIVRHTEALVKELQTAWDARHLEFRNEKHTTAGLLADLTGVMIQMTAGAATTLWFAHNLSLAQFEALLKEHRAFLCSVIPPLSETIDRIMTQQ